MFTDNHHIITPGQIWLLLGSTAIGIGSLVYAIRFGDPALQSFLLYNLPDGLWAFGFAGLMLWLSDLRRSYMWLGILALIGVAGEVLQLHQVMPGTFDYLDILCYLGGITLAILCHLFLHHKTTKS